MKTFYRLSTLTLLLFISVTSLHAQETKANATDRAKKMTDQMKTELSLSDSSYTNVYAINLKYAEKNSEIMSGAEGRLAKLKSLKASNEEKEKEMKAVLTKEQFKKYKELMKERKADAKEAYKNRN
ncbi:MAG TPA: hypothetical protein VHM26_06635 [Chitinophagaceae bacterium]|nr:hypothetical protein [Chitinophagaceae bacterium]